MNFSNANALTSGMLLLLLATACGMPLNNSETTEAPEGDNDPSWFGLTTQAFDKVKTEAKLDFMPWPDHYWATYQGGISYRWQTMAKASDAYKDFLYKIPTAEEIAEMTEVELNKLSPAEKYDIWQGRTDLASEDSITGNQRNLVLSTADYNKATDGKDAVPSWAGICNGWSLAAISEKEPQKSVTVELDDGRNLTFYVADIKALLDQVYNDFQNSDDFSIRRLGNRCEEKFRESNGRVADDDCRDMNPMTLHLALSGYIGKNKPFIVDVDPGEEVWNQPAYGYEMSIGDATPVEKPSPVQAKGTKFVAEVSVNFSYIEEPREPVRDAIVGTPAAAHHIKSKPYRYVLELDSSKRVVGGEWKSGSTRPDFIWATDDKPKQSHFARDYPLNVAAVKKLAKLAE